MSVQTWWLFVLMTFVVSAIPGPNMLLVMTTSARLGFRASTAVMAGCMTALQGMMALSAAGLGALLQTFPSVFDAVRLAGAAYLAYLGIRSWCSPVTDPVTQADPLPQRPRRPASLFRQGFLVAASNPKAILFAAAFLPQFIRPESPRLPQFVILLATFAVIETSWYVIYAASGQRLAAYLRRTRILKTFNRLTGGVFIGFAAAMAAARD